MSFGFAARLGFGAALAVVALASPSAAEAAGGQYNLVQCHPLYWQADAVVTAGGHPSYATVDDCSAASTDPRIGIYNTGAAGNTAYKQFMYQAPFGTHIETACLDYNLRRDSHHQAELLANPGFQQLAFGLDSAAGWTHGCFDLNNSELILRLSCAQAGGCAAGPNAHAYMRSIVIALADDLDPTITAFGGDITAAGWLRGTKTLVADGADAGAGVYYLSATVNGTEVGGVDGRCRGSLAPRLSRLPAPCDPDIDSIVVSRDTAEPPFVNGENVLMAVLADFGSNAASRTMTVRVDNARPTAAFVGQADPSNPERIRASIADAHSGLADAQILYRAVGAERWQPLETQIVDGQAGARVDSSAVPPGEYEFILRVSDVAGNSVETTLREDGSPMRLSFPLRTPVILHTGLGEGSSTGQTVPYGTESDVHGRLLDATGEPLAGQPIVVVEHFDNGALFPRAERPTVTDEQGRFTTPIPAGPTRTIEATFAGTGKYLPEIDEVGRFAVKGAASFMTSDEEIPEGSPITFSGKVKHLGARIPAGGKLVEVQYRLKTGRQRTLKEPFRTEPDGSYSLRYRFSKALTNDALFRFRVKLRNEGNWPFKGSVSKWRKVVVRAH